MAKRRKKKKQNRPPGWQTSRQHVEQMYKQASKQLIQGKYANVIRTCERIIAAVPPNSRQRAEALQIMGNAYGLLKQFDDSYETLSQALEMIPEDPYLWFNRSLSAMYTSRTGQAFQDLERAVELEGNGEMAERFAEQLELIRGIVVSERKMRGVDFSLEQLIEQQELFQTGIQLSRNEKWAEAKQVYTRSIAMGDCLPQPWGNLAVVLIKQQRYDEAETALTRALEIDPEYAHARHNLKILPKLRKSRGTEQFAFTHPFQDANIGIDIFLEDD